MKSRKLRIYVRRLVASAIIGVFIYVVIRNLFVSIIFPANDIVPKTKTLSENRGLRSELNAANSVRKRNTSQSENKVFQSKTNSHTKQYNGMPPLYNMKRNKTSGKKLILYFNRPWDWRHKFDKCEYNQCEFTDDKRDYFISDAILFHSPNVYRQLKDLPPKPKGQIWIYMSQEPPSEVFTSYSNWTNVFNWTWTNRRDSDIYDPYGEVEVKRSPVKLNFSDVFKNKNKTSFWYVSHCKSEGKREDFVKILQNYIDIDVYGKCSELKKTENRDKYRIGEIYKFYLAFENSLCKDYITEKVLHLLAHNTIVPIVRGEPTAERFLPPGSYIDTKTFKSATKLGKYLKKLQFNETEYIRYFDWKNYYKAFQIQTRGICSFCKLLHTDHQGLYTDIDGWVNSPAGKPLCNKNPQDMY